MKRTLDALYHIYWSTIDTRARCSSIYSYTYHTYVLLQWLNFIVLAITIYLTYIIIVGTDLSLECINVVICIHTAFLIGRI